MDVPSGAESRHGVSTQTLTSDLVICIQMFHRDKLVHIHKARVLVQEIILDIVHESYLDVVEYVGNHCYHKRLHDRRM